MTIDKLRVHYGFSRMPFSRDLAPNMLYTSQQHREATARLDWLIAETQAGVLTGEVGSGKTVAARAVCANLDTSRHTIIYLANPSVGARGIYYTIVNTLGQIPRFHKAALIPQTSQLLATEHNERRKHVVVICDEAHLLSTDQLEELRLLTNADMDSRAPFTLILLGQPTLRRRLRLGAFAALDQRIALRYHLDGMNLEETVGYIKHHLQLAGRADPLFSDDALTLIHQTSRGIPRAVNNLAVQALVAAYTNGKGIIDHSAASAAVTEVTSE